MLYIAGKAEPMCIGMSNSGDTAALYKLHLRDITPFAGYTAHELPPPTKPIMEEVFKRKLHTLYSGHPAFPVDDPIEVKNKKFAKLKTKTVDTSADLACSSVHPWVCATIKDPLMLEPPPGWVPPGSGRGKNIVNPFADPNANPAEELAERDAARKAAMEAGSGDVEMVDGAGNNPFGDSGDGDR